MRDELPETCSHTRSLATQGLQEYNSDTFDDWRDLLEEQERRMRDELDASKV